jgi:hypothetical protein
MEKRTLWQVAWVTVATIGGCFVVGLLIARITSNPPILAIIGAGIVMLVGLYFAFACAGGWWPYRRDEDTGSDSGGSPIQPAPTPPRPGGVVNYPGARHRSRGSTYKGGTGIQNLGDVDLDEQETTFEPPAPEPDQPDREDSDDRA